MFKTRLAQWGYLKKMRDIDWQAVAVLHNERKTRQKASVFKVHGRKIKLADLKRYLKDRKISEDNLLAEAAANDITSQNIPDHIRCSTPLPATDPPDSTQDSSTSERPTARRPSDKTRCSSTSPVMSASAGSESFEFIGN